MKNFGDLTINDNVYFLKLKKDMFPLSLNDISGMKVDNDIVIDKYSLYKVELEKFGFMEFGENDLKISYEIAFSGENDIIIISTDESGIIIKLKELLLTDYNKEL